MEIDAASLRQAYSEMSDYGLAEINPEHLTSLARKIYLEEVSRRNFSKSDVLDVQDKSPIAPEPTYISENLFSIHPEMKAKYAWEIVAMRVTFFLVLFGYIAWSAFALIATQDAAPIIATGLPATAMLLYEMWRLKSWPYRLLELLVVISIAATLKDTFSHPGGGGGLIIYLIGSVLFIACMVKAQQGAIGINPNHALFKIKKL